MAYSIEGRMRVSVFIEDQELPFGQTFQLDYIHLSEGTKQALPYFVLAVTDSNRWLVQQSLLKDGLKVSFQLQSGEQASTAVSKYEFRLGSYSEDRVSTGTKFVIEGMLDAPNYLNTSSSKGVEATSANYLKEIASASGLTFEGVGTNDKQVWWGANRRLFQIAESVSSSGYATENSAMALAVTLDKKMIYRDLVAMDNPVGTLGLLDFKTAGVAPVTSMQPVSSSGPNNQMAGYSMETYSQDLMAADAVMEKNSKVGATLNEGGELQVNKQVITTGRIGRVTHAPLDAGNVHENFVKARHQNARGLSLFSFQLEVVVPTLTTFKSLDTVTFDTTAALGTEGKPVQAYAGSYRVAGRVIYVTPGHIVEKLTLSRRTINLPASTANKASGLALTNSEMLSKVSKAPFSIKSIIGVPNFDLSKLNSALSSVGTQVAAMATAFAAGAVSAVSNAQSAASGSTPVTPLVTALLGNINSIKAGGLSAISAIRAVDPTDLAEAIPPIRAARKASIEATITAAMPAIEKAARQANSLASASLAAASAAPNVMNASNLAKAAADKAAASISKLTPSSLDTSALAGINSALASGSANISSSAASATAQANTLLNDASTYSTQINSAKSSAFSALDAA